MDNNGPADQQEVLVNFNVQHTEAQRRMREFQNSAGALEQSLVSAAGALANFFSFNNVQAVAINSFNMAKSGINDMIKSMTTLQSSSGLTAEAFKELQGSIRQAANETGNEFGNISTLTKNLFDQTGLKKGLGEAVLDSQRMSKVFGSSDESFGKLAVKVTQFSGGVTTANDMMSAFNKTSGITGTRMDAVLESMSGIANKIRQITGGGAEFGPTMKKNAEFTSIMAAKFTEMGGNSEDFLKIQDAVLDPRKWQEISRTLPGLSKFLPQMIEATASGDMESYAKFFQQGMKDTYEMGMNMGTIQRGANGFAMVAAEISKDLNFAKLKSEGAGAGTVLERSAKQIQDLTKQGVIFFTNIASSMMTWLSPIIETISGWMSSLNAFLATCQGHAMSMIVGFALLGITMLSAFLVVKRFFGFLISDSGKAGKAVGEGLGKGIEAASTGIAAGIGNLVTTLSKNALQLLAIGAGFMLAGAGMWMMAEGIATIAKQDFGGVALGLGALAIALGLLIGVAFLLANPIGWIAIATLAALGGAIMLFGIAAMGMGIGIKFAADGIEKIATMAPKLASLKDIDFSGITKLGEELTKFSNATKSVYVKPKVLESMTGLLGVIVNFSGSIDQIIQAGETAKNNSGRIQDAITVLTGPISKAVEQINDNLVRWWGNKTIPENVSKSLDTIVNMFQSLPDAMIKMADFGDMLEDGKLLNSAVTGVETIFGTKGGGRGVFGRIQESMNNFSVIDQKVDEVKKTFDVLSGMIPQLLDMADVGDIMRDNGMNAGLRSFSKGLSTFMFETNAAANQLTDGNYEKIMRLPEMMDTIRNSLNTSLKIETKGSAEVAIQEHNSATSVHYSKVEKALEDILVAVKEIVIPGPAKNPVNKANQWQPASMFSEESETF